mmetsp:Transcript_21719/g.35919  ORF Transcript_21719/g.35919 Transcript_21719/m.35919 type:complete len:210 (+) Transcript_21719:53-682(+)
MKQEGCLCETILRDRCAVHLADKHHPYETKLISTYKTEYIERRAVHSNSASQTAVLHSTIPFEGTTTFRSDFVPFASVRPRNLTASRILKQRKFDGLSTCHADYTGKPAPRNISPTKMITNSNAPVFLETTQRADFVAPPTGQKRLVIGPSSFSMPTGVFNATTMYRSEFSPKKKINSDLCRRSYDEHKPLKLDADTTYRADYIPLRNL